MFVLNSHTISPSTATFTPVFTSTSLTTLANCVSSSFFRNVLSSVQENTAINLSLYPSINSRNMYATGWATALAALADYAELKIVERERTTTELRREYCRWEAQQGEQGIDVDTLPLPDWTTRVPRLLHPTPILLEHKLTDIIRLASRIESKVQYATIIQIVDQSLNTSSIKDSRLRISGSDNIDVGEDGKECIL